MAESDNSNNQLITELTSQLAKLFQIQTQNNNETQTHRLSDGLKISIMLDNSNFSLWSRMMKVAIGGKSDALLNHLTEDPPANNSPKWNQEDLVVFSWLIQNIEPQIATNLTQFPTAKALWNALITTYSSGKDKLQTFDLHAKAYNIRQGGKTLEELWLAIQGIWGEIDIRDPNPMELPSDIIKHNNIRSEQKLFQFLNALDHKHDNIKRELLRLEPLPTAEAAYAAIRKENANQTILGAKTGTTSNSGIGTGLISSTSQDLDGVVLITRNQLRPNTNQFAYKDKNKDKDQLECTECGMKRHTRDQCFKVIGYPDWWADGHKKGKTAVATVAATRGNPEVNNSGATTKGFWLLATEQPSSSGGKSELGFGSPTPSSPLIKINKIRVVSSPKSNTSNQQDKLGFESPNSSKMPKSPKSDGGGADNMNGLGLGLGYTHIRLNPPLPDNLQKTPPPFLLLDIRTEKIIGRGTERDGLYYVDEVTRDENVMLAHGSSDRQAWLWHRRLGHPSAVFDKFTDFHAMIKTQFQSSLQVLRSDNGGEFINAQMKRFCQDNGIIHQTSCPHTPQQNGVAERKNRILLEITRPLMIESKVPKSFWPEAVATATYLVNRLPTRALDLQNPIQTLSKFLNPLPILFSNPAYLDALCLFIYRKMNEPSLMLVLKNASFSGMELIKRGTDGEVISDDTVSWLDILSSEEITHGTLPVSSTTEDLPETEVSTDILENILEIENTNHENEEDLSEQQQSAGQEQSTGYSEPEIIETTEQQTVNEQP
ncbi:uncharacterized protein [Rutidosis leptorrhynchoides]|uniref:uncharacterized protein n=1 Tax=Rutidosis leptorrhynchoides TaxID=125765 RepID=UPI003A9A631D